MAAAVPLTIEPSLTFDRPARLRAAVVAAAFFAVFWERLDFLPPDLGAIVYRWIHDQDWSHGPIIPLFSAYLVYLKWDQIRRCRPTGTWIGLVVMLAALALYVYTLFPYGLQIDYVRDVAMMLCLLGVIIYLCGLPVMRYAWLPWLYLFFAIPIPKRLHFEFTTPLRHLAASVATWVLSLVPELTIEQTGVVIDYYYRGTAGQIGVADACSGMRSTITLCALGVAVAFMTPRPWWQRLILIASCVPIATFCNFLRVTVTCIIYIFIDPAYATGNYHMTLGLIIILLAFGIFSAIGWALNHLFVEEHETEMRAG